MPLAQNNRLLSAEPALKIGHRERHHAFWSWSADMRCSTKFENGGLPISESKPPFSKTSEMRDASETAQTERPVQVPISTPLPPAHLHISVGVP